MTKITDIEDARFLKAANLPLNLRIKQRTFSLKYSRRWVDLMKAHTAFVRAVNKYTAGARAGSPGKWKLMRRRLTALDQAAVECIDFVDKLGGNVQPPVFKSEQDGHEYMVLASFITERALPFIQFWADAVDAVEAGTAMRIDLGDIPPWIE
jgi:hypothetical protein